MGFIFNFIKRIVKLTIKLSLYLAIFATLIVFIPNLPPYTKFTSIELSPTQPRVGPLAPNNDLNNVEQKYKGKLVGPETFQVYNSELYTSLSTGEIVKISPGGHITFVTKVGLPCTGLLQEDVCGRPLGFEIDDKGKTLYVADAYHGIWKVDLKTDKKQLLVSPRVKIEKRSPKLFNSVALAKNGDIYWTDSSSEFGLKDLVISMTLDPSGRVFHYNAAKNESKVLVDDLWFPNGLVLSPNNDFLVIAESCRFKLLKHYVSGPKKGQTETFVDGLPGAPDNVRALPDGSGVLVGLFSVFDDEHPLLQRSLSNTPLARKFLARLQRLIEIPFEYLNSVYPHIIFQEIVYFIGHCKSVLPMLPPSTGLLQIDWNGNIVAAYFNNDKSIGHISDGIVYNDKLYLGSPQEQDLIESGIGSVPAPPLLKKAFESVKKSESPKVETKPQQAKPKVEEKPTLKVEEVKLKENLKPKVEQKPKVVQEPKVEQKPKVVQEPKVVQKPKVEEKPKVAEKPKVEQKPNVEAKPKVVTKPNVEEKKNSPKDANKPTQTVKEPQQPPKKTTPSPKTTAPPVKPEVPKTTAKPQATTTPKPVVKPTPPPAKPTEKSTPAPPKPTEKSTPPQKTTSKTPEQPKKAPPPNPAQDKVKEQIPIKEDIPSDTAKPTRDTLKVIKKGGVKAEIPVHNSL